MEYNTLTQPGLGRRCGEYMGRAYPVRALLTARRQPGNGGRMRKAYGAAIACVLLSSCAASQQEKDEAIKAYVMCLESKVSSVDDRRSDALTVGYALQNVCFTEIRNTEDVVSKGMMYGQKVRIREDLDAQTLQFATRIVLENRAGGNP